MCVILSRPRTRQSFEAVSKQDELCAFMSMTSCVPVRETIHLRHHAILFHYYSSRLYPLNSGHSTTYKHLPNITIIRHSVNNALISKARNLVRLITYIRRWPWSFFWHSCRQNTTSRLLISIPTNNTIKSYFCDHYKGLRKIECIKLRRFQSYWIIDITMRKCRQ